MSCQHFLESRAVKLVWDRATQVPGSTSLPTVRMDDSIEVLVEPASPTSEHSEKHHPHVTRILGKEVVREKLKANQPFKAFVKKGLDFYMALVCSCQPRMYHSHDRVDGASDGPGTRAD